MLLNETEVCNQALAAAMVRTQIASINDNNTSARACKLFYETTRDDLLSEAAWGFAQKWAYLALSAQEGGEWVNGGPSPGWRYQYQYPADCIRCNIVLPKMAFELIRGSIARKQVGVSFELSTRDGTTKINTNAELAIAGYTQRVIDTSLWSPAFGQAMVARLSYRVSVPLSGDKQIAASNFQLSNMLAAKAREGDGNEGLTVIDHLPDWLAIRDTYNDQTDWP